MKNILLLTAIYCILSLFTVVRPVFAMSEHEQVDKIKIYLEKQNTPEHIINLCQSSYQLQVSQNAEDNEAPLAPEAFYPHCQGSGSLATRAYKEQAKTVTAQAVQLAAEWDAPKLVSFQLDSTEVNVTDGSKTVGFTIKFQDASNMEDSARIYLYPAGLSLSQGVGINILADEWQYNESDQIHTYTGSWTLDISARPGNWEVLLGDIEDEHGNATSFIRADDLIAQGFQAHISVINDNPVDTTAPELINFQLDNTDIVVTDGSKTVGFTIQFKEASKMEDYAIVYLYPSGGDLYQGMSKTISADDWQYNETDQIHTYTGSWTFDSQSRPGGWQVLLGTMRDEHKNATSFIRANDLIEQGFPAQLTVHNDNPVDITPPKLINFQLDNTEVDVSDGAETVGFTIQLTESSKMESSTRIYLHPTGKSLFQGVAKTISEDEWTYNDAEQTYTYTGRWTIEHNALPGSWQVLLGTVKDEHANGTDFIQARDLHNTGFSPYVKVVSGENNLPDTSISVSQEYNILSSNQQVIGFDIAVEQNTPFTIEITGGDNLSLLNFDLLNVSSSSRYCLSNSSSYMKCTITASGFTDTIRGSLTVSTTETGNFIAKITLSQADIEADLRNNFSQLNIESFAFPWELLDHDGDGVISGKDSDDDGDGVNDSEDLFPLDNTKHSNETDPSTGRNIRFDNNGDGKADILWRNNNSGQNWLWTMNGQQVGFSEGINTISLDWEIAGRGDFDGDGRSDIVWRNRNNGRNWLYLMDGKRIIESSELNYVADPAWVIKGVADFSGDGKDDILWHHQQSGRTWMYLMDGLSITQTTEVKTVSDLGWQIAATGDVNGDGNFDIIWRHDISGRNYIWLMDGSNILESYQHNTISTSWAIVGAGDLNGDGTDDIVWRNSRDGRNWAHLMKNGYVEDSLQINTIADQNWKVATIGDFDGDGQADIFWHHQTSGKTYIYLMDTIKIRDKGFLKEVSNGWGVIHH